MIYLNIFEESSNFNRDKTSKLDYWISNETISKVEQPKITYRLYFNDIVSEYTASLN